mmetsp:Transcript_8384/g.31323  ORF Transcript_8384/g.31323 Transcript_8384/m.31323 type:complete len:146 (-) Transcript_8384:156-593(-)
MDSDPNNPNSDFDPNNLNLPRYAEVMYGLKQCFYVECSVTLAEAIAMFAAYYDAHDPCSFTKINGPYTCENAAPLGVAQRFSLAYANALLAYTIVSAAIIHIFFGAAKRKAEGKDVNSGDPDVEKEFRNVAAGDEVQRSDTWKIK